MAEQAELLLDCRNQLGEGIRWHIGQQRLYWCDIQQSKLWSCDEDGGDAASWHLPERLCSFAFSDRDDVMLLAMESGLYAYHMEDGGLVRLTEFEPDHPTSRMNDGVCDRQGNFVVGGMDQSDLAPTSSVIRFRPNGSSETLLNDVGCTNSMAFDSSGSRMYFADTRGHEIYYFDYDPNGEVISERRLFATVLPGRPDGSTVDAEDHLWNAQWGGGQLVRYGPDGLAVMNVKLPVSNVTCCTFGGADLDHLYITTAWDELTDEQHRSEPLAGGLFRFKTDVRGLPDQPFLDERGLLGQALNAGAIAS